MSPKVQGTFRQALDQAHRELDEQEMSPSDKKISRLSSKHITGKALDLKIGFKGVVGRVRAAISSSKILSLGRTAADQLLRKAKGIAAEVKKPKQEKKIDAYRALLKKCAAGKLTNKEALRLALKLPLFIQNLSQEDAGMLRKEFRKALADLHTKGVTKDSPLYPLAKMSLLDTKLGHAISREDQQFLQNHLERNFTDLERLYTQEEIKELPLQKDFFKTGLQKALNDPESIERLVGSLKDLQRHYQGLKLLSEDDQKVIESFINQSNEANYLALREFCTEKSKDKGRWEKETMFSELKNCLLDWEMSTGIREILEIDVRHGHEENQLLVAGQKALAKLKTADGEKELGDFPRFIKSVADTPEQIPHLIKIVVDYLRGQKEDKKQSFTENIWLQIESLLEKLGSSEQVQDSNLQLLLTAFSQLNPIAAPKTIQIKNSDLLQLLTGEALKAEKTCFVEFVSNADEDGVHEWFTEYLQKLHDLHDVNFQNAAALLLIIQEFLKQLPTYAAKKEAGAGADDITPIVIYLLAAANNEKVLDLIELLEKFSSGQGSTAYICTTLMVAKNYILEKLQEKTSK